MSRAGSEPAEIGAILDLLGAEIRRPLDALRVGIDRLIDDPTGPLSEPEAIQARTIRGLCDDLDRLTRECLATPGSPPPKA